MSRRAFDLVVVALLAGGCGARSGSGPRIDLCTPDEGLRAALSGGHLQAEVRALDGTPLAAGVAAVDKASALELGSAADGQWIVLEALDSGDAPIGYGAAQVHDAAACVCMSRTSWYAYATWEDGGGLFHDGGPVGFFVRDAALRAPDVDPQAPLTLDHARVQSGDTLRATLQYVNGATAMRAPKMVEVLARPPGATHASGLVRDFSFVAATALAAGATLTVDSSRTFSSNDAAGAWGIFTRLTDELGVTHDSPEVSFAVGGMDDSTLLPTAPPRVDPAWVSPPGNLHMTVSYENRGAAAVDLQQLVLTARPPGGSNDGGPFDDLSPKLAATTVAPNQAVNAAGDRSFPLADDPCSGMICVVAGGKCSFSMAP